MNGDFMRKETVLERYMIPFLLSLAVAVSVQASGINSVLNYSVMIMDRAGFKEIWANWADVAIKAANFLMTIVACLLVDRKGRKFLLTVGSGGLLVGTLCVGGVFLAIERFGVAPSRGARTLADGCVHPLPRCFHLPFVLSMCYHSLQLKAELFAGAKSGAGGLDFQ